MHWTVKEASEFLQVPEETIYDWIQERALPATRFNGRFHFNRLKLIDWAQENRVPFLVQNGVNLPSLSASLKAGGFRENVPGGDKPAVFKNLVDSLKIPSAEDRELLCQMMLSREREGSTELGNGIALPHARHPVLLEVSEPLVSLAYLKTPIPFGRPGNPPVSVLFLILSPSIRMHLHLLERLGLALHDKEFSALVLAHASAPEIMSRLEFLEKGFQQGMGPSSDDAGQGKEGL